jgi:hypothetical protein
MPASNYRLDCPVLVPCQLIFHCNNTWLVCCYLFGALRVFS